MAEPMETTPCSEPLDLDSIRSRIKELSELHTSANQDLPETVLSDSDKFVKDCALDLESKVQQIIDECSDVGFLGIEDLDTYVEQLKEELKEVEADSAKISDAIEVLSRTNVEESNRLDSNLEALKFSLDLVASQTDLEKTRTDMDLDSSTIQEDQPELDNAYQRQKFEILELDSQIEKNKIILESLQDLDVIFKRFDAIEQIEDALTGLKVVEFDGNCIRLSLKTYIPKPEHSFCQQHFENIAEPSEMEHELLIEIMDGTMELKKVEMFPNDVYIGDIVDAAKSHRHIFSKLAVMETRSSLQWFVGKVQDRIILSTLRRTIVKSASKLRHSFEYMDREEIIVAHLAGGVDAFIKVSQGWPLADSPLKLISVKSSEHHSMGISLSLLCKVEELANSLDTCTRQNLSSFVDAVEKLLVEQMRLELQSGGDIP
ncbi:hypothetical protein SLA2020_337540 [Shorea laevis]